MSSIFGGGKNGDLFKTWGWSLLYGFVIYVIITIIGYLSMFMFMGDIAGQKDPVSAFNSVVNGGMGGMGVMAIMTVSLIGGYVAHKYLTFGKCYQYGRVSTRENTLTEKEK